MHPQVLTEEIDEASPETPDLRGLAACNDESGDWTEVFFSEDLYDIARAKHLCGTCPGKARCLAGAMERREPWGVWGGELFVNGHVLAQKRRRGRPPKNRAAEVIVIDGQEVVVVPAIASA
jgi:WhiB family redox-sensing transcriptional regulator